jgi:hypothetical protein
MKKKYVPQGLGDRGSVATGRPADGDGAEVAYGADMENTSISEPGRPRTPVAEF